MVFVGTTQLIGMVDPQRGVIDVLIGSKWRRWLSSRVAASRWPWSTRFTSLGQAAAICRTSLETAVNKHTV